MRDVLLQTIRQILPNQEVTDQVITNVMLPELMLWYISATAKVPLTAAELILEEAIYLKPGTNYTVSIVAEFGGSLWTIFDGFIYLGKFASVYRKFDMY